MLILLFFSCNFNNKTDDNIAQFQKKIQIIDLIKHINLSVEKIKTKHNNEILKLEDSDKLHYHFTLNETNYYEITYLFDEKGCFEVSLEANITDNEAFNQITNNFKDEINNLPSFVHYEEANLLYRWNNSSKSLTVELDVAFASSGMFSVTIFANE